MPSAMAPYVTQWELSVLPGLLQTLKAARPQAASAVIRMRQCVSMHTHIHIATYNIGAVCLYVGPMAMSMLVFYPAVHHCSQAFVGSAAGSHCMLGMMCLRANVYSFPQRHTRLLPGTVRITTLCKQLLSTDQLIGCSSTCYVGSIVWTTPAFRKLGLPRVLV